MSNDDVLLREAEYRTYILEIKPELYVNQVQARLVCLYLLCMFSC